MKNDNEKVFCFGSSAYAKYWYNKNVDGFKPKKRPIVKWVVIAIVFIIIAIICSL